MGHSMIDEKEIRSLMRGIAPVIAEHIDAKISATDLSIGELAEEFDKIYRRIEPLERELIELRARSAFQYRGVWKADDMYAAGDFVTFQGGLWHCSVDSTKAKPGNGPPWTLAVKSGAR